MGANSGWLVGLGKMCEHVWQGSVFHSLNVPETLEHYDLITPFCLSILWNGLVDSCRRHLIPLSTASTENHYVGASARRSERSLYGNVV